MSQVFSLESQKCISSKKHQYLSLFLLKTYKNNFWRYQSIMKWLSRNIFKKYSVYFNKMDFAYTTSFQKFKRTLSYFASNSNNYCHMEKWAVNELNKACIKWTLVRGKKQLISCNLCRMRCKKRGPGFVVRFLLLYDLIANYNFMWYIVPYVSTYDQEMC